MASAVIFILAQEITMPSPRSLYEDTGLFTCDEAIAADVTDLFNYLTGYSTKHDFRKLLVAPINLRSRIGETGPTRNRTCPSGPKSAPDLQGQRDCGPAFYCVAL